METLDYRKLVETAMLAGTILISSGAETYRIEDTTYRILKTSGFETAESFVLPTGITLTLSNESDCTYSITKRISPGDSNMNRIIMTNAISRDFCSGKISLDEAHDKLKKIKDQTIYPKILKTFGCSFAGGGFALMFGGNIYDFLVALICSFLIGLTIYYLSNILMSKMAQKYIFVNIFATAMLCILASSIALFTEKYIPGIDVSPHFVIAGSIMSLVPGLALTNAIRDLLHGDFVSACARFVEAITKSVSIAVGALAGIYVSGLIGMKQSELSFVIESSREPFYEIIVGIMGAYIAMIGFSIIFEIPKRFLFFTPLIGSVSWVIYLLSSFANLDSVWGAMFGAIASELLSFILARRFKAPVTLFLVTGIIPLVPGFYIYRASYYLITSSDLAGDALINTLIIAGTIALGIILMNTVLETIARVIIKVKENKKTGKSK